MSIGISVHGLFAPKSLAFKPRNITATKHLPRTRDMRFPSVPLPFTLPFLPLDFCRSLPVYFPSDHAGISHLAKRCSMHTRVPCKPNCPIRLWSLPLVRDTQGLLVSNQSMMSERAGRNPSRSQERERPVSLFCPAGPLLLTRHWLLVRGLSLHGHPSLTGVGASARIRKFPVPIKASAKSRLPD
jgi:hypothetical protein